MSGSVWDVANIDESAPGTHLFPASQTSARPSDVQLDTSQLRSVPSISTGSKIRRLKPALMTLLAVAGICTVVTAITVPLLLTQKTDSNSTTSATAVVASGATPLSTASTASTASTTVATSSTTAATSPTGTTTGATTSSTTVATSSTTVATSSTTAATSSTSTTTPPTTTASLVDPCSSGTYWNATRVQYWGTSSSGTALNQLSSPTGLFINRINNNLYIADGGNYRIIKQSLNVTTNSPVGNLVAGATGVSGTNSSLFSTAIRYIYVDSSQNLYVADTFNNRIMLWPNSASNGVMVAGNGSYGTTLNQLSNPYGVWVDSTSNIFIAEYASHRVTKWASGATVGVIVAGFSGTAGNTTDKLASPSGLYYDEINQDLYIANSATATSTVMRWRAGALNGTVVAGVSGSPGNGTNQLRSPMSMTLDQWNNIYIADRSNGRVQLYCNGSSTGITIAGSGATGSSSPSTLTAPYDVKLDSQLNLYVCDNSGSRVSKFVKL